MSVGQDRVSVGQAWSSVDKDRASVDQDRALVDQDRASIGQDRASVGGEPADVRAALQPPPPRLPRLCETRLEQLFLSHSPFFSLTISNSLAFELCSIRQAHPTQVCTVGSLISCEKCNREKLRNSSR